MSGDATVLAFPGSGPTPAAVVTFPILVLFDDGNGAEAMRLTDLEDENVRLVTQMASGMRRRLHVVDVGRGLEFRAETDGTVTLL